MKRHLLLSLTASLLAIVATAGDFTYTYEGQTLTYTVLDETAKTCEVGRNSGIKGNVVVPAEATTAGVKYTVTRIGHLAFYNCYLNSVSLPNTIESIESEAFYASCVNAVDFGTSVKSIGMFAFQGTNLTKVNLPNSVKTIADYAFETCLSLSTINLASVETIGELAFRNCNRLKSVTIPKSVTSIGQGAFTRCGGLKEIIVDSANANFVAVDGVLFDKDLTTLIQYPAGKTIDEWSISSGGLLSTTPTIIPTEYVVPNSVKNISGWSFASCYGLVSVDIPMGVETVGYFAFDCKYLRSVTIRSIQPPLCESGTPFGNIQDYATLNVPDVSLETYKSAKYWQNFPNIVGFEAVDTVKIGSLNYIVNHGLKTATVTFAEQNSLSNYEGLQGIIIPETVEFEGETYKVTAIGKEAFNNCWGLKAVSLPETLQSVDELAFGYCTSLRSVTIPDNVTTIADEAFTGCSALASVTIGNSVETIGDYAFFGCTGLAAIHVPESVKSIGENAFMGIHWIDEVHAKSQTPAEAPASAFSANAYKNATLVVPDGAAETYKVHPTWSNFMAIREVSNQPTKIEVVDGAIVVKGAESVLIYNTSGAQVYVGEAGRIELPSGIYLVATDSVTKKVRI